MQLCLLVIDVQESFRSRDYFDANALPAYLQAQNQLIAACVEKNMPIVRVFHTDAVDDAHNPFSLASGQVTPLTGLTDFDASLTIYKQRHSAFVGTNLSVWLTQKNIQQLIISGIRTEQCCETTTRHASDLGYDVMFALDATLTFDMQYANGEVFAANDIKQRTATVLQGRFADVVDTHTLVTQLG